MQNKGLQCAEFPGWKSTLDKVPHKYTTKQIHPSGATNKASLSAKCLSNGEQCGRTQDRKAEASPQTLNSSTPFRNKVQMISARSSGPTSPLGSYQE